jgi:protein AroM
MSMEKIGGKRLALVTIGQAPRVDITPDMMQGYDEIYKITEFGALDGLTLEDVAKLAPKEGEDRLISRMKDGEEVVCSHAAIEERLVDLFARIDADRFDAILMLCSGKLTEARHSLPVFSPYDALNAEIAECRARGEVIGMISPLAEQMGKNEALFDKPEEARFAHVTPYGEGEFEAVGETLKDTNVIIMNCMGFDSEMAAKVEKAADVPTLTVRQIFMKHIERALSNEAAA